MSRFLNLSEKTVMLTGPNSSLGRAIAIRLAEFGANVALIDKNQQQTERLANEINDERERNETHGRAAAIVSDVSKPHHAKEIVSKVAETFGGLDIYIDTLMATHDMPVTSDAFLEDIDRLVDINLKAPLFLTRESLPFLTNRRRSRIIYLTPELADWGAEGEAIISSTRLGLKHLTKVVAKENSSNSLTVNCISVGPTEDYLTNRAPQNKSAKECLEELKKKNAYLEICEPADVANLVAFIASPMSNAVSGQIVTASNSF